eukprot:gnl/TRDRNA2_/TRDRNA2_210093_c0_seq1.p1 gnl/TRDRNA2_/TRDRNA2_210093_c0~~gnl/TRDRNA2_/TRDRNA2_210093_c0_seq1.p1  ORF type:complete len:125 (-),score=29.33 gnl/TRDRNA2_/TRDRNA2_210093_c0_seq1:82-456(-)
MRVYEGKEVSSAPGQCTMLPMQAAPGTPDLLPMGHANPAALEAQDVIDVDIIREQVAATWLLPCSQHIEPGACSSVADAMTLCAAAVVAAEFEDRVASLEKVNSTEQGSPCSTQRGDSIMLAVG